MGKAARWLRGLLGMKKDKENVENSSNCGEQKEKKRWSFAKSGKVSVALSHIPAAADSARRRLHVADAEKEQSTQEIAAAATAVVRRTSQVNGPSFAGGGEIWAAVKIQTVFRGYLARKARRALKGLVKLQALVRGFLVRKRAAATLHSMQALIRVQNAVRSQRARCSISNECRLRSHIRARKSIERFDERGECNSKRLSASHHDLYFSAFDGSPKTVEIDTYGPKSRSRRISNCSSEYGDELYYQAISSPFLCPSSGGVSVPGCRHLQDSDWGFVTEDYKFATARNTPRFGFSGRAYAPGTPTNSVCGGDSFTPYSNCPNYMANTNSFKAKLRSRSTPKQRPESGPKKRISLNEIMASRSSFSGVRMHRSCSKVEEDFEFY